MGVIKEIRLIGISKISWEDAAKNALKEAGKTIRSIRNITIDGWSAQVEGDDIIEYQARARVDFLIER